LTVGLVACSWLFVGAENAVALDAPLPTEPPAYVEIAPPTAAPVWISEELQRSIRLQALIAQWHVERGATSSIEDMCSRPAYLRILAMGPDILPLLIAQLRSEKDDPDHWFVALHHLSGGEDPIPDEDKGDMVRMAKAWVDWAEREIDGR